MHEIELDVPADHVEEHVVASVAHLEVGHSLRIKDLELPVGARPVHSVEETVVTCLVPGKKAAGEDGATAEPEIIGRKLAKKVLGLARRERKSGWRDCDVAPVSERACAS